MTCCPIVGWSSGSSSPVAAAGCGSGSWSRGEVEICRFDPGFGDDLVVTVDDALTFARWHMGGRVGTALRSGAVTVTGPRRCVRPSRPGTPAPETLGRLRDRARPADRGSARAVAGPRDRPREPRRRPARARPGGRGGRPARPPRAAPTVRVRSPTTLRMMGPTGVAVTSRSRPRRTALARNRPRSPAGRSCGARRCARSGCRSRSGGSRRSRRPRPGRRPPGRSRSG